VEIFHFEFMRRAFIVGILLSAIIPCIGLVVVLKRLSMIGDALSHSSLAGVAGGLLMGVNPVLGAVVASVGAALGIEAVRRKLPRHAEMAVSVVMSAGVGLAGVLSGRVSGAGFNSFLFGSIVAISDLEMLLVCAVSAVVLAVSVLLYKELFCVCFDERLARLAGVPVSLVNLLFVILTALTVSVAARTVGALVVSSMMVVPVACGMQVGRSYRDTLIASVLFAMGFTVTGLFISYYAKLASGGTIVLTGVAALLLLLLGKTLFYRKAGGAGEAG